MNIINNACGYIRQVLAGIEIDEICPGLYQSSAIRWPWDSSKVKGLGIQAVIDLSGQFDPSMDWLTTYLYWPIKDELKLPKLRLLDEVARWGLRMRACGLKVLTH